MSQVRTRKRAAPGASPLAQTQQQPPISPNAPQDPTMGWQSQDNSYADPTVYGSQIQNSYSQMSPMKQSQITNQLARRTPNQPIVPIQNYTNTGNGPWQVGEATVDKQSGDGWPMQYDDLDQKALIAKRDAEAKRKQIPPFVQKLSSFLDESRNTDLIRWSESGDSFIVVDEDEFAKTLIPELFKHNNYASFVRQLNMYGFHKKVGLSDNSMRASERKNKNPSEYSNPYFKRGRPNLLWLIQKPKNSAAKGTSKGGSRAKQEDYDEEIDETFGRENSPLPGMDQLDDGTGMRGGRQNLLTMGGSMPTGLPQDQLSIVQRELAQIRGDQHKISHLLNEVRSQHKQLYGQAKAFHDLHEKHNNSINAILTFLATVYNKNLNSGQGGMGDMFPGSISPNEQQRGNVVDMGDLKDQSMDTNTPKPFRRGPLLLEDGKISPTSPNKFRRSSRSSDKASQYGKQYQYDQNLHSPAIQELSDHSHSNRSSESPTLKPSDSTSDNTPQIPQADIMSMLNNATLQNTSNYSPNAPMDFSEALSHLQNSGGSTPLTPGQRQNMLQLMGDEYQSPNNNALAFTPNNNDDLARLDQTSENLDQLGQIIREQGQNINNLSNTLTPLSPTGSIPGVINSTYPNATAPDPLDLDNIFNSDSYFNDPTNGDLNFDTGGDPLDFDFGGADGTDPQGTGFDGGNFGGLDGTDGDGDVDDGARVKEMGSSAATSPAGTVGVGSNIDVDGGGSVEETVGSPGKRRRIR